MVIIAIFPPCKDYAFENLGAATEKPLTEEVWVAEPSSSTLARKFDSRYSTRFPANLSIWLF